MLVDFITLMHQSLLMHGGIRTAVPSLEARCSRQGAVYSPSRGLSRLRRLREASEALRRSVRLVRSGARVSDGKVHRRAVGALQTAAGVYAGGAAHRS